jgi:hypothetical protein
MARTWTDEQRQQQRERILNNKPWLKSTGPRTAAGKAVSSQNATVHGYCSARIRGRLRAVMRAMKAKRYELKALGIDP